MNELAKVAEGNDVGELLLRAWQTPAKSSGTSIHHPKRLELVTGLEPIELDMDWVWVAEKNGQQVCSLVVANCHGIAFLLRLISLPDAPPSMILRLLRKASEECRERGLKGFVSMFDMTGAVEKKLWRIAKRLGAVQIGKVHILAMSWRMM